MDVEHPNPVPCVERQSQQPERTLAFQVLFGPLSESATCQTIKEVSAEVTGLGWHTG
jgi:hypothetical protein